MAACTIARTSIWNSKDGIAKFRKFVEEAADLVVSYGGSISGEHGDGQARAELLPRMFGAGTACRPSANSRRIWDPDWKMNPGKVIEPYRMDENLRLGADYNPWQPRDSFQVSRRPGQPGPRHSALRRRREMPPR